MNSGTDGAEQSRVNKPVVVLALIATALITVSILQVPLGLPDDTGSLLHYSGAILVLASVVLILISAEAEQRIRELENVALPTAYLLFSLSSKASTLTSGVWSVLASLIATLAAIFGLLTVLRPTWLSETLFRMQKRNR